MGPALHRVEAEVAGDAEAEEGAAGAAHEDERGAEEDPLEDAVGLRCVQ